MQCSLPQRITRSVLSLDDSVERVWVLGFPAAAQTEVCATLSSTTGRMLHPLPTQSGGNLGARTHHHCIVAASTASMQRVLEAHTQATAVGSTCFSRFWLLPQQK
jgi:hypothetical protein